MDPVSVIGLVGSIVGIIDVSTRAISALRALQQRWKIADLKISLLISQLTTLKAALSQIEEWISTSLNVTQHYQLVLDFESALESCETLLLFIDAQLIHLHQNDSKTLSFESRVNAVLEDNTIKECATHLAHQSTALNLLLTALNCRSLSGQGDLLQTKHSRRIFDQVEEDSSSLFGLRDPASFRNSLTASTERSSQLDKAFDFDPEVTTSKVYHRQLGPLIRGALRRGRKSKKEGSINYQKAINIKIWVPEQSSSQFSMLLRAMSILYERQYEPMKRKSHIYQIILDILDATFERISASTLPMDHEGTIAYVHLLEFQQTKTSIENMPQWLQQAFVSLWKDPYIRKCYHDNVEHIVQPSATYFLDSIARIVSEDYVPSFDDAALSLLSRSPHSNVLALEVGMGPRVYNFVTWTRLGASSSIEKEESEELDAILFIAEPGLYKTHHTTGARMDEWDNTLQRFRFVCDLPWLAKKDILLVFSNIKKLASKPFDFPFSNCEGDHPGEAIDDVVTRFLSSGENGSRKIHVILADDHDTTRNLSCLDFYMQMILNKKAVSDRHSWDISRTSSGMDM